VNVKISSLPRKETILFTASLMPLVELSHITKETRRDISAMTHQSVRTDTTFSFALLKGNGLSIAPNLSKRRYRVFCKVIYTAKAGSDRRTFETYMNSDSSGEMRLAFDKDVDWSEPILVVIEPAVELNCQVGKVLSYDPKIVANLDSIPASYVEKALEREKNRPVNVVKDLTK